MNQNLDHDATTPLMRQYFAIKNSHPDALLLFQVGDFYELFFDDAQRAAHCLGIALTKRGKINGEPIPLCGVPLHAIDHYIPRLIKAGFKIAVCDQLEEAKPGKVVERGVTQVLTPGTLVETKLLDARSASYLFSFFPHEQGLGLVFGELLTAQIFATMLPSKALPLLESELVRFFPDEIIMRPEHADGYQLFFKQRGYFTSRVQESENSDHMHSWVRQFGADASRMIGQNIPLHGALATFHDYALTTQKNSLPQFTHINFYQPDEFLILDSATQRNLELVKNSHDGSREHTLFSVLDGAHTPMGSRMIKKWILRPLVNRDAIEARLQAIDFFVHQSNERLHLERLLKELGDLERTIGRIGLQRGQIHDFIALKRALGRVPEIMQALTTPGLPELIQSLAALIHDFSHLSAMLEHALQDDALQSTIIKKGFNEVLDSHAEELHGITQKIVRLEAEEQQLTGINSLKIRYTSTFGYYIEITKTHMDSVPNRYMRRQTLVGKERYTTIELQQLEHALLTVQRDNERMERELFDDIKARVVGQVGALRKMAHAIAQLDALIGLACVAYDNNYVRPTFNDVREIRIERGRHPVIEQTLHERFIGNSTQMTDEQSVWIIAGPNMGGKSTYLRQVALIGLMAHIGSFVPANAASLPILDRVFTRIGAGDNLAEGKSTFLVEMEETAHICTQATRNSLVILDEVGRGTSTYDGLALAQAIIEYLHTRVQARCLFATHYQELTALEAQMPGIVSYYAANKKTPQGIVFLYAIVRGVADGSFGLEVAKLAGLPQGVIERARDILGELNTEKLDGMVYQPATSAQEMVDTSQRGLLCQELASIDWDALSPKAAFDILWRMREKV